MLVILQKFWLFFEKQSMKTQIFFIFHISLPLLILYRPEKQ